MLTTLERTGSTGKRFLNDAPGHCQGDIQSDDDQIRAREHEAIIIDGPRGGRGGSVGEEGPEGVHAVGFTRAGYGRRRRHAGRDWPGQPRGRPWTKLDEGTATPLPRGISLYITIVAAFFPLADAVCCSPPHAAPRQVPSHLPRRTRTAGIRGPQTRSLPPRRARPSPPLSRGPGPGRVRTRQHPPRKDPPPQTQGHPRRRRRRSPDRPGPRRGL